MLIEDGLLPDWSFEYDGDELFDIQQDESGGETYVANIIFTYRGEAVLLKRPINSREAWPLYIQTAQGDFESVFDDNGKVIYGGIAPKGFKNLETANYALLWGDGQGRGTFIIIRRADDTSTLRNTGSEAIAEYNRLLAIFKKDRSAFDAKCAKQVYTA
jgi:hypothetical protein